MDGVNGSKIKLLREAKGWTQKELGNKIHSTKSSISQYENNKKTPTNEKLIKIAEALNTTPYYLLDIEQVVTIKEDEEIYETVLSENDLNIIKEIKKHKEFYNKLCVDTKNTIDKIIKILY